MEKLKPLKNKLERDILRRQLARLSEDIIQDAAGLIIPNIEEKRLKFRELHAGLRILEGKSPRDVK